MPDEDAIVVSEELGRRFGLPKWQYTSSATHANTEAIRVARVVTGREKVLLFDGKYHGHLDEALVELDAAGGLVPEERGIAADTVAGTVLVPFNDPATLGRALERRDVALVLTEPAITNNVGLLLPQEGFHAELRRLTRATGTLLAYDETHTQVVGPGGLTALWDLEPDIVTAGKSIAGGVRRAADPAHPDLARESRRVGGDRRSRAGVPGAGDRRGCGRVPGGLGLAPRRARRVTLEELRQGDSCRGAVVVSATRSLHRFGGSESPSVDDHRPLEPGQRPRSEHRLSPRLRVPHPSGSRQRQAGHALSEAR